MKNRTLRSKETPIGLLFLTREEINVVAQRGGRGENFTSVIDRKGRENS